MSMHTVSPNATLSYGHVLARSLGSSIRSLPEDARQRMVIDIQARILAGVPIADRASLDYVLSLLNGQRPSTHLGHQHRNPTANASTNASEGGLRP